MPKCFRAEIEELFENHTRHAGYVYALTKETVVSRVERLNKRYGEGLPTVLKAEPEEIEITEGLHKTLSRDKTTSVWSPHGKSKGDLST